VIQRNFPAPAWLDLKTFAPQPSREQAFDAWREVSKIASAF